MGVGVAIFNFIRYDQRVVGGKSRMPKKKRDVLFNAAIFKCILTYPFPLSY